MKPTITLVVGDSIPDAVLKAYRMSYTLKEPITFESNDMIITVSVKEKPVTS